MNNPNHLRAGVIGLLIISIAACGGKDGPSPGTTGYEGSEPSLVAVQRGQLTAEPNPILVCDDSALGITTVHWQTDEPGSYEIRVGSPTGPLFAKFGQTGSSQTGKWITPGMLLVAVEELSKDVSASVTIELTTDGCN